MTQATAHCHMIRERERESTYTCKSILRTFAFGFWLLAFGLTYSPRHMIKTFLSPSPLRPSRLGQNLLWYKCGKLNP